MADPPPIPEKMILSTTDSIDGKTVSEYLGIVRGFSAKNLGMKGLRVSTNRIELENYSTLAAETQMAAEEVLVRYAEYLKADAVVGLRSDVENQEGICVAMCYGTAVKFE